MNNALTRLIRKGVLLVLLFSGISVSADIVYPARLQMVETAPGVFEVYFVLPVIQGKIVKAQAVFPEFCQPLGEPVTEVDAFQKKMRWQVGCGDYSLTGRQIGIEGLLGSQVDIILEVTTLDGRIYKSTLSPARPFYSVPEPPGLKDYLGLGALRGGRYTLLSWGLFLAVLVYFLTREKDRIALPVLMLGAGMGLGHFLSWGEWILTPSWAALALSLLVAASLACLFVFGGNRLSGKTGPVLLGLAALLYGAGFGNEDLLSGYTPGEELILTGFTCLGFLAGALLLAGIARQLWRVVALFTDRFRVPAAKLFAGASSGALLWQLSLFWNVPSMLPSIPLSLVSLALVLVLWQIAYGQKTQAYLALAGLLLGYWAGLAGFSLPGSWAVLLGVQGILLILVFFNTRLPAWAGAALLLLAGTAGGNYLQFIASDSLSYPLARSVFFLLLLLALSLLLIMVLAQLKPGGSRETLLKYAPLVLLPLCLASGLGVGYAAVAWAVIAIKGQPD